MWTSWTESAKSSLTQALEKTGDVISRAATEAGRSARLQPTSPSSILSVTSSTESSPSTSNNQQSQRTESSSSVPIISQQGADLLKSLSSGWSTVIETTKASIKTAEETVKVTVKEHQQFFQQKLTKARVAYYKRDASLPLDVEALKDAEVVYITDRIITMGHPALASQVDGEITGERKLAAVGHLLNRRHEGRYMVWNLSELAYDIEILDDQVLTFSFPGSPSPPLGLLLKLLVSMESWLKADSRNVAVVHCLTGKGRTSTVLAAFLCWMGEAGFSNINDALEYIAMCKQITSDELTIPSQRRYSSYFKNMLDGVHPSQPPLMLKRVIMSVAPSFVRCPSKKGSNDVSSEEDLTLTMGCVPYIQIFKAGKLVHTAPASLNFQQAENELPFCSVADGSISFHIDQVVQGDILIRARHITPKRKRVSMFRAAFHTGYVPPKVMRLTKSQLDGACNDERFPSDFFLDLIFEPADAEAAGKLLQEVEEAATGDKKQKVDGKSGALAQTPVGDGNLVTASTYDSMLHRDSRFWDVITERKKLHDSIDQGSASEANADGHDPMFGPTVGRRRTFNSKGQVIAGRSTDESNVATSSGTLESFSIGGELDFLPAVIQPETDGGGVPLSVHPSKEGRKKDSLMEALMGALDEDVHDSMDMEVVIFDSCDESNNFQPLTSILDKPLETATQKSSGSIETSLSSAATGSNPLPTIVQLPPLVKQNSVVGSESKKTSSDDVSALMKDVDSMKEDDDLDRLLAASAVGDSSNLGAADDDVLNLDIDDAELADLESFLSKA